jgi:hypothetical protein
MDYGKVLSRAWEITWRWKALWILGFLAALGRGGGGGGNYSYRFDIRDWNNWGYRYHAPIPADIIALVGGLLCLAILIGIALWVISVMARGGLIAGVQQVEEEKSTNFLEAWRVGRGRFWTLFGIGILTAIPTIILVLIGIGSLILLILGTVGAFDASEAAGAMGIVASLACGGALCCGAIVIAVVLNQIRIYAERAAILEGLGWIGAIVRGWHVLRENLGPTIVYWLIFFAIGLVLFTAISAGLVALFVPFLAIVARMDQGPWLVVPALCGGLLSVAVAALISAIVETFSSATWTLAYREMTGLSAALPEADQPAVEPASA